MIVAEHPAGAPSHERAVSIDEYRRLEALYEVRAAASRAIVQARDGTQFLDEVVAILAGRGAFLLAWVALVQPDETLALTAIAGDAREYAYGLGLSLNAKVPGGRGPSGIALRSGEPYVCNDFQRDPTTRHWHERARAYGIAASSAFPIRESGGIAGLLMVYSGTVGHFGPRETALLTDLANEVGAGLESIARAQALELANARARAALRSLEEIERVTRSGSFRVQLPEFTVWWSEGVNAVLGFPDGTAGSADRFRRALGPAAWRLVEEACQEALDRRESVHVDVHARVEGRGRRWVEVFATPETLADGRLEISGLLRDVEERRHLEAAVAEAEARERQRIGADLHDELGQLLTAVGLQVHALERDVARAAPGECAEQFARLEGVVGRARAACRTLARSYVAPASAQSLAADLEVLADDVPDPFRCTVRIDGDVPEWLAPRAAQELLRIVQEAVNNALRHGGGRTIRIALASSDERLDCTVDDDGAGFDAAARGTGVGLVSMRQRAARAGGVLRVRSAPGGGTTIRVSLARTD